MAAFRNNNSTASLGKNLLLVSMIVVLVILSRPNLVRSRSIRSSRSARHTTTTGRHQIDGTNSSGLTPFSVSSNSKTNGGPSSPKSLLYNKLASGPSTKGPGH
uniref:Uncharacterized protein n=1 Tax=Nelumbo nucifera TaxID=4432 RepID=A0A822Z8K7_NELNU|nr:TPA_asm: hypothetical protein HUJ06_015705 [Nelumbo nucifera]